MDKKRKYLILGTIPGGILGWLTKPLPSVKLIYSSNPNLSYLIEIATHIAIYAAATAAIGFVIGYLLDGKKKPPYKPKW